MKTGSDESDDSFDLSLCAEQDLGFDPEVFEESVSANISLTLPGKILSHNADIKDGNTLTWKVSIFGGELVIAAESDPNGSPDGGSSSGGAGAIIVPIILVLLAAGGWYLWNRNKNAGGGADETAASAAEVATDTTEAVADEAGETATE